MRSSLLIILAIASVCALPASASPATASDIHVDSSADCAIGDGSSAAPFCSLSTGYYAAASGDRVLVAAGTYQPFPLREYKDVTIIGTAGADQTLVDLELTSMFPCGEAAIVVRPGREVTLEGLTFFNARCVGPIESSGTLTLRRCVFRDTVSVGLPVGASVVQRGGGTLTIEACDFTDNRAGPGAGVRILGQDPVVIRDSWFHNNRGGHLSVEEGAHLTIDGCTFSGVTTYTGSTGPGFGIIIQGPGEFTNSTFSSDSRSIRIAAHPSDTVHIRSCTFRNPLFQTSGSVALGNSLFAGDGEAGFGVQGSLSGTFSSDGFNIVSRGQAASGLGSGDLVGSSASPIDPGLGPLADHGGPTPTISLLPSSPAIGAGNQTDSPSVDQRGRIRPFGSVDIGAYQSSSPSLGFDVPGCWGAPNASGTVGHTAALNSAVVSQNSMVLAALDVTPDQFGIFLASRDSGFTALASGNLCLSGTIGRFNGPGQIRSSGPSGRLQLAIDLTMIPQGSSFASGVPGETWFFQAWHRDPFGQSSFAIATAVTLQ